MAGPGSPRADRTTRTAGQESSGTDCPAQPTAAWLPGMDRMARMADHALSGGSPRGSPSVHLFTNILGGRLPQGDGGQTAPLQRMGQVAPQGRSGQADHPESESRVTDARTLMPGGLG